jgi:hypothetical protein
MSERCDGVSDLSNKNTAAFREAIADLQARSYAQQVLIDAQRAALSGMAERMTVLERMLTLTKARSIGTGPTVIGGE